MAIECSLMQFMVIYNFQLGSSLIIILWKKKQIVELHQVRSEIPP